MFKRSEPDDIKIKSSLRDKQLSMVLQSISEGNTEGRVWSWDEETYFLWDKGNIVFYIFGEKPSSRCLDELPGFFEGEIVKDAGEENYSHFKLDDRTGIDEGELLSIFMDHKFMILEKYLYIYMKEDVETFESSLEGLRLMDIDEEFLKNTCLENLACVINEVKWMWPSFRCYYENGFGKAAVVGDEIICWCTAEYVSEGMCGVGIETLERYRGEGVGTVTAAGFISDRLEDGVTPYWECDVSNVASVRLAEKLGFEKIGENRVLLGRF